MSSSKGTKRARSAQESKSEHPSKKLCESKPGSETVSPLNKKRVRFDEDDLEEVEQPAKKLCDASKHPQTAGAPADASTDDLFEVGLTEYKVLQNGENPDDEAQSKESCEDLDGDEPNTIGPLTAYKPDLDFDAELAAALGDTSDTDSQASEGQNDKPVGPPTAYEPDLDFDAEPEVALGERSDTDSQANAGEGDEPGTTASQKIPTEEIQTNSSVKEDGFGDDFEAELEAAFEDDPGVLTQSKIDGSLSPAKIGSAQADESLAKPSTPPSKTSATEGSASPQAPSNTTPTPSTGRSTASPGVDSTTSTPDRPSASRRRNAAVVPPSSGLSFKDRRPVTAEDRTLVANAISWTYGDLHKRTGIHLDRNSDSRSGEIYDTRKESFSYQYGFVQHRYKSYMEVQDSKLGIDTGTKAYQKKARRKYEKEDLLDEVEGEWKSFDDWGPPKPKEPVEEKVELSNKPVGTIDLTAE